MRLLGMLWEILLGVMAGAGAPRSEPAGLRAARWLILTGLLGGLWGLLHATTEMKMVAHGVLGGLIAACGVAGVIGLIRRRRQAERPSAD